jgi:hypothetical protein
MLTNLRLNFDTITDFSFLHRLPQLQSLMMDLQRRALWPRALEALTNPRADAPFAKLTELNLHYVRRMTVEDLEAVLRQVPRLTSLDLLGIDRVKSLRFLSSAAHLRSQLTYLGHRRRPARTVPIQDFFDHIVPLQELTHLSLWNAMDLRTVIVKHVKKHAALVSGEKEEEEEEEEDEVDDAPAAAAPSIHASAAIAAALSAPALLPALRRFDFVVWDRANIEDYSESMENSEEEEEEE